MNPDLSLVDTWIAKGEFQRALAPLEKLVTVHPKDARAWKLLGVVKQQLKFHEEAARHLLHSIELDDSEVDAHCSLGGVYLSLAEFDKAKAAFERGLELSKNDSTFALLNYLTLRAREGKLDEDLPRFDAALAAGEASCRTSIDAGRNLPWAYFDLAQIQLLRGVSEPCRESLTQAVRLSTAAWQLGSAVRAYRLIAESPNQALRTLARELVELLDARRRQYFASPEEKLCFVIMPFGKKVDLAGAEVDFDEVYKKFIKPAMEGEGLKCIRCDEVDEAGNIHKRMFELIWQADVAIADVSIPNPNVFYELGARHALRKAVTVIIRNKNAELPFNIANMSAIEYTFVGGEGDDAARARMQRAVKHGLTEGKSDSHVNEILDLRITDRPRVIGNCHVYSYQVVGTQRQLSIVTGDLRNVRGIDVWVNSENTNMQMARYYDFAISSVIRFEGAKKKRTGHVEEDLIQHELNDVMDGERSVPDAEVVVTGPGELKRKYGVQAIFHAASVRGAIGAGYEPVPDIHRCVTNALSLMDNDQGNGTGRTLSSILFPLLGIGFARGDFRPLLERQVEAALAYLNDNPGTAVENICFLAWSEQELALCQSVFRSFDGLGLPVQTK